MLTRVRLGMIVLMSSLGACAEVEEDAVPETGAAFMKPVKPLQCDPNEPAPPIYIAGSCTFEIRLDQVENLNGQGVSEGDMEVSVVASAGTNPAVAWPSSSVPLPPGLTATSDFFVGEANPTGNGMVLATVTVPSNTQRVVPACATFTEHDNGGANGVNDVGTACVNITLTATSLPGGKIRCDSSPQAPAAETDLCGDNQCNGRFKAHFEVMVSDADGDEVINELDFTPGICDEELKGQLGRASLIYFHMGDGPMTTLGQHLGTNLGKATTGYDYVVMVMDEVSAGPFMLNQAALNAADLTLLPTEANLYEAMQEITKRGYDMDIWIWSHGWQVWNADGITSYTKFETTGGETCTHLPSGELCGNNLDDDADNLIDEAACAAIPGGELCWTFADEDGDGIIDESEGIWDYEITQQLVQALIGTDLVPIRMVYSGACYHQGMNWAWETVGAYVASGTENINFYPNYYAAFADAWDAGQPYGTSAALSSSAGARAAVHGYMSWLSGSFNCDDIGDGVWEEGLSVLNTNECSRDFFVNDGGGDNYQYDIGDDFDPALSGIANMDAQSLRFILGNATIQKYSPATLTW